VARLKFALKEAESAAAAARSGAAGAGSAGEAAAGQLREAQRSVQRWVGTLDGAGLMLAVLCLRSSLCVGCLGVLNFYFLPNL